MIAITGSEGFIGRNLFYFLKNKYKKDILLVDKKRIYKSNVRFINYKKFLTNLKLGKYKKIKAIFHQGANSKTTEKNFKKIMNQNYFYTKDLIDECIKKKIKLIYASSASVYGINNKDFDDTKLHSCNPENFYAISKFLIDVYTLAKLKNKNLKKNIVGLRYFNVYGPHEDKKKSMASVFFHFNKQLKKNNKIKLFKGHSGYLNGEQKRDFVHVDDIVKINFWFFKKNISGIFNCGTGKAETFNRVAKNIIQFYGSNAEIIYIDMPKHLKKSYQNFTKANIKNLRYAGYKNKFITIKEGVKKYLSK